jgi:O-antigen/teichoic acid export membrane protein
VVTGAAYWRLLVPGPKEATEPRFRGRSLRAVLSFGSRIWLGSVASMLLARVGFLFMAPLSSVEDLGLYTVATTISDLPLVVALAIQGTLYGVDSKSADATRLTTTTRVTLLLALLGCMLLGVTLPLWIGVLFGAEFVAATVPTMILLFSALICIPGLMAASGVAAWGRPGVRSAGLVVTLIAYSSAFLLLVPALGVYGACLTSIISNLVLTTFMVTAASRLLKVRPTEFLVPRIGDARLAWHELGRIIRRLTRRGPDTARGVPDPADGQGD